MSQLVALFPFGLPKAMMKIRESALTPFASTSHFMNFGLKSSGFSCSELSFFEDEYVVYVNPIKIIKSRKRNQRYLSDDVVSSGLSVLLDNVPFVAFNANCKTFC